MCLFRFTFYAEYAIIHKELNFYLKKNEIYMLKKILSSLYFFLNIKYIHYKKEERKRRTSGLFM